MSRHTSGAVGENMRGIFFNILRNNCHLLCTPTHKIEAQAHLKGIKGFPSDLHYFTLSIINVCLMSVRYRTSLRSTTFLIFSLFSQYFLRQFSSYKLKSIHGTQPNPSYLHSILPHSILPHSILPYPQDCLSYIII